MSSKKHRKKLKDKYNNTKVYKPTRYFDKMFQQDSETVLNYLKEKPNTIVPSNEIIESCDLYFIGKTQLTKTIQKIREIYNVNITSKSGRNGGYMYYEQTQTN